MKIEVIVPSVGESISEGVLSRWVIPQGAHVNKGDTLFELGTDKANTDVPSPETGIVHHLVAEGAEVAIGSAVATIDTSAAAPVAASAPAAAVAAATTAEEDKRVLATSVAKKMAAESNVDLSKVSGTGSSGRVTSEDIANHLQKATPAPAPATPAVAPKAAPVTAAKPAAKVEDGAATTREKMTPLRRKIAERLVEAQHTAAMLTTFNDVDMSAVMNLRNEYKEQFEKRHGVKLGFMSFFAKAAVEALKMYPLVNAMIDGTDIVLNHRYHIGVAVSTERGLTVPVIRNIDQLSFADVEKEILNYAKKARDGKLSLDDLQGGTFTITNGGVFGSMLSTPILNPPQSAILGMHRIEERPIALNGQVVIRPMMYLALSYDHRIIDGKEAVSFLVRIKQCIENPARLLLEV
ncbi:MAG: 2-oxoglutarate dehydrogenase complex dihydrolipoyllysine-residue succinyltransferase [Candidatus Sumerlaeia bacterium]|nr:2-oxoglutarate dehydrogenase complex dihydrolipoyllysine-residue succinyltransferase [Candidatus Sumerlaeia bacterium]